MDNGAKESKKNGKKRYKLERRRLGGIVALLLTVVVAVVIVVKSTTLSDGLVAVRSEAELKRIYDRHNSSSSAEPSTPGQIGLFLATMPWSFWQAYESPSYYRDCSGIAGCRDTVKDGIQMDANTATGASKSGSSAPSFGSSNKEYSTTNIQVENVDEADIVKTNGNNIFSISGNKVVITDVANPAEPAIAAEIEIGEGYPEELILDDNKLVVIAGNATSSSYYYGGDSDTIVKIFDISNPTSPKQVKKYQLDAPYYTSRRIGSKLYVLSSGRLQKEGDGIAHHYSEDGEQKDIPLSSVKRLKNLDTDDLTTMAQADLNDLSAPVSVQSYLMNVNNAYVSEHSIYLVDEKYSGSGQGGVPSIRSLFSIWGVFGPFMEIAQDNTSSSSRRDKESHIYKFAIGDDGKLEYSAKTKTAGKVINQFSLDEYKDNLRVAVETSDGSRVVVFNDKLNQIGASSYLARGENMYSSRFMGDRAYLVTYLNTDPLFAIDLSQPTSPKVLGELKIPGYSTYLHPYDDTHLIGIGMDSEEYIVRDYDGTPIRTTARITGMKMALFDVSDVGNPKQLSSVKIGDSYTKSAVLTNHKALLFSKEKQLLAIPVNNYTEEFVLDASSTNNVEDMVESYTSYSKAYVSEGYQVYNINLTDGITLRGSVTHEQPTSGYRYNYYGSTKLLRGLYIENDLYTVSEDMLKVNRLDNLDLVSELSLRKDK
ncbi:MAG: beta-propeller domain-containing protein [Candidatus Nomurabacteria bacterium]|jgi:uncharacterized secreted protein with C-terminal beta-propeller domain|nr:beta-propeller domain-containing protein [Candidatus Nomurabacteria bacterium]